MAFEHLNGSHLLEDNVSWESYTGAQETASTLNRAEQFATAEDVPCNVNQPSQRWTLSFPEMDFQNSIELWLGPDSTMKRRDKVTYDGTVYRVVEVAKWAGIGRVALCQSEAAGS